MDVNHTQLSFSWKYGDEVHIVDLGRNQKQEYCKGILHLISYSSDVKTAAMETSLISSIQKSIAFQSEKGFCWTLPNPIHHKPKLTAIWLLSFHLVMKPGVHALLAHYSKKSVLIPKLIDANIIIL